MTKTVQQVRHSSANAAAYTGPQGQITAVTDSPEIRLHDGITAGGYRILSVNLLDVRYQQTNVDLTAIMGLSSTAGILAKIGNGSWLQRQIAGDANGISVANPDGATGNPTISFMSSITWTGKTITGGTFTSPTISGPTLKNTNYTKTDLGTVASGTATLDRSTADYFRLQVGGALTIAVTNWPATGQLGDLILQLVNGGSATVTFPAWNWVLPNGSTTTSISTYLTALSRSLQTSGRDYIVVWTDDNGATPFAKLL